MSTPSIIVPQFSIGDEITHPPFGDGKVIDIEGDKLAHHLSIRKTGANVLAHGPARTQSPVQRPPAPRILYETTPDP